jgi:drug/metabolite transporter (DMT)-like permease
MKLFTELAGVFLIEALTWVFLLIYGVACFWIFDLLHITNSNTQVMLGVAPLVVLGLGVVLYIRRHPQVK